MTATLTVAGTNLSARTRFDLEVEVGRDNVDSQPDASVLSARIDGWRDVGQVTDPVVLTDPWGQVFKGTVTDLQCDLDPTADPPWATRLTAVGPLADVGRALVGDEPWPEESDSHRVHRILTLAGVNTGRIVPEISGPSVLARDIDRQDALGLAQDAAADAYGVLWEQPADPVTPIRYTPQRMRVWSSGNLSLRWAELPPTLTWATVPTTTTWATFGTVDVNAYAQRLDLDAGDVVADLVMAQRVGDLIRRVRVLYGSDDVKPRPEAVLGSGQPEVKRDTQLSNEGDALSVADTILRSHREPAWHLQEVTLKPLDELPGAVAANIRTHLAVGTRLTITGIVFDGPVGTVWQGYIEGWTYQLIDGSHVIRLHTSQRALTEPADRWGDISPTLRWRDIPPSKTWDETGDL